MPVEQEVDYGPVPQQVVRPLFQAQLIQISILAFRVLDVWLFHPQVELFMQAVNEEGDVLLTVLLIIADELVAALAQSPLEDPRVEG